MIFIVQLLAQFLAVMVVITFHEFAHAYVANKCGDPTARLSGRMTLNPVKHFDPLGILMFVIVGFGWAKPVPVNPNNFRHYRRGSFFTSAAGIAMNYLMAFLFAPIWGLVVIYVCPLVGGTYMEFFLGSLFSSLVIYSLSFCVFNLLPFYPLDGFRIIDALDKKRGKIYWFLRQYGQYILLGLVLLNFLSTRIELFRAINILEYVLIFVKNILAKPIANFWEWIFSLFQLSVRFIF